VAGTLVEHWTYQINRALGLSTGWVMKAGQLLVQAKKQLLHGQWMSIFEQRQLKFGLRKAECLMAVVGNRALCNSQYWSNLPRAWTTLYVLSQLPADSIEHGINTGVIHAGLKLAEAQRLLQCTKANTPTDKLESTVPSFDLSRQQTRLLRYVRQQAARWPGEYRAELAALLETVAAELRKEEIIP
jgi:hypothetical protein